MTTPPCTECGVTSLYERHKPGCCIGSIGEQLSNKPSILEEALPLIDGKADQYGEPSQHFAAVAAGWNILVRQRPMTAEMIPLMMVWLKVVRESHKHKRDNLVDMAGYAALIERIVKEK